MWVRILPSWEVPSKRNNSHQNHHLSPSYMGDYRCFICMLLLLVPLFVCVCARTHNMNVLPEGLFTFTEHVDGCV